MLVAVGANLPEPTGSPTSNLVAACRAMAAEGLVIRAVSRFFATPCFPAGAGPDYVNAAVRIRTGLSPVDVLSRLHAVEAAMGRQRETRWGMRTLDLDLVAAGAHVLPDPGTYAQWQDLPAEEQRLRAPEELILPHPRLAERAFVLVPLADIAPGWIHPVSGLSVAHMLSGLPADVRAEVVPL